MTATTAITTRGHRQRPLLPIASLALAGAALAVGLVAITTDDEPATSNVVTPAAATASSASGGGSATGDCFTRAVIVRC
jgi:hypothetical protein